LGKVDVVGCVIDCAGILEEDLARLEGLRIATGRYVASAGWIGWTGWIWWLLPIELSDFETKWKNSLKISTRMSSALNKEIGSQMFFLGA
jgi:hypothetical protein